MNDESSAESLIFSLYLKPSLMAIGFYQIAITSTFTAQQFLLAAYLDQLGLIVISGLILAAFFLFWFLIGPISGSVSDQYGLRKTLMISSNIISAGGFFGLVLFPDPLFLFLMNSLIGIGASLRLGSTLALWVQHSPQHRLGESMGLINIIMGIGGVSGALLGLYCWLLLGHLSFVIMGGVLLLSTIPIFFVQDTGIRKSVEISKLLQRAKLDFRGKISQNFFITAPIIKLSIHWIAFSTIISFSTFLLPILDRVAQDIPPDIEIPLFLLIFAAIGGIVAILGGLMIWGAISDKWARRPVLVIGFLGTGLLILTLYGIVRFRLITDIIVGASSGNPIVLAGWVMCLFFAFLAVSLVPAPMAWIIDQIGSENVAKAMSLRQALIGLGTIIGTILGGYIIGVFSISGLLLVIFLFLALSTVILV